MNLLIFITGYAFGILSGIITTALCYTSKRSDEEMKKIDISEIGFHEYTIAKCGFLSLICKVYPKDEIFIYEVKTNTETLAATTNLNFAIEEYNKYL